MPRRRSLRSTFNQIQRIIANGTDSNGRMSDRARQAKRIANRYRANMQNSIARNRLGRIEDNLDTEFDRNGYTRATAIGSNK